MRILDEKNEYIQTKENCEALEEKYNTILEVSRGINNNTLMSLLYLKKVKETYNRNYNLAMPLVANSIIQSLKDDEKQCSICYSNEYKVMGCGHLYCMKCLNKLDNTKNMCQFKDNFKLWQ
jgi:hypothetical protein